MTPKKPPTEIRLSRTGGNHVKKSKTVKKTAPKKSTPKKPVVKKMTAKKSHHNTGQNSIKKHKPARSHNRPSSRSTGSKKPGRKNTKPNARPKIEKDRSPAPINDKLKIYALGGLEEIGRNCTVLECGDDIIIVDAGFMFPEEDMHGIDYIVPNISSLEGKEKNIRGIIITHGHMDHIGGIPHMLGPLGNPPIYTAPLTAGMVKKRVEEHRACPKPNIVTVKRDTEKFKLGTRFKFQPFHINHNISDAFGAAIDTPYGKVLVTGDFKFDYSPVNEEPADLQRIAMFGAEKPLLLMSDSTDAEHEGYQISEKIVGEELDRAVAQASGRIIVGTFSSLLTRVQQLLWAAEKTNRKVLVLGRSMLNTIELAHNLGYLKYKPGLFVQSDREFNALPDNRAMIICTGAQGERNAALMRIATGEHRSVSIQENDTIIFSSSVIPGNERSVQYLKDTLVRRGAKIVHYKMMDVHAGGHAKAEDLKLMLRLTQPRFFMPIHGNRFMLHAHVEHAVNMGVKRENCFIANNGQIVEIDKRGGKLTDHHVETDFVMVDGLGVGDVSHIILRERQALADDGMFVVICTIRKKTGQLVGNPDLISRGFIYMKDRKDLVEKTRKRVKEVVNATDKKSPAFEDFLKRKIRDEIGQFLYSKTHRRPMVLPVLIEV